MKVCPVWLKGHFWEHSCAYCVIPDGPVLSCVFAFSRGKFGVVRRCVEKHTGTEFAAKFVRKRRRGQDCRREVIHEVSMLELTSSCSRVINLHEVYETPSEMVLLLE